jgi:adenylate cyclase
MLVGMDSPSTPTPQRTVLRVLMVDDAPGFCRTVGMLLEREGDIEFKHCQQLDEALRLVVEFEPDVILQDLVMPGIDGLEMIREYRRLRGASNVPVIVLSAADGAEHKTGAFLVGADDYVRKDAQLLELLARIRYHGGRYVALKRDGLQLSTRLSRSNGVRLMVVEPTKTGRSVLAGAFKHERDITVHFCGDARAALRMADDVLPTVIVLSLFGGDYDGFELIQRLRAKRSTHDVPILFYTSTDDPSLKARAFESGANDYAIRTQDFSELIGRVKRHSAHHLAARQARLAAAVGYGGVADASIKMLLATDDRAVAEGILAMLQTERGVECQLVETPTEVPALVRTWAPTVLVLDLDLRRGDALAILRAVRDDEASEDMPVLVLSEHTDPSINARAFALGASDHIEKRVDKIEFVSRLHHHARAHVAARELRRALTAAMDMHRRVEVQSDFIRRTFGRYLSDGVVDAILEHPEGLRLGGESRLVTLMMTDLRGFTTMSESLAPQTVLEVLNGYFDVMTSILMRYEATIDEFIGDAILALFGAPNDMPDHAARALACAVEMQNAMVQVNKDLSARGLPELEMGIGINTGEVVVGNVGSERRTKYGVVGRNVNLTSRIESYTIGGQILVADSTVASAGGRARVRSSRKVEPKGVKTSVTIHDVVGVGPPFDVALTSAEVALMPPTAPLYGQAYVFEEKARAPTPIEGRLIALGSRGAAFESTPPLSLDANVQLALLTQDRAVLVDDVFAKVIACEPGLGRAELRFTSLSSDARTVLRAYLPAG